LVSTIITQPTVGRRRDPSPVTVLIGLRFALLETHDRAEMRPVPLQKG